LLASFFLFLVWLLSTIIVTRRNPEERRIGDYLAGTVVLLKQRPSVRIRAINN
jgi:uncharacterized RDD family membrane protein YckC